MGGAMDETPQRRPGGQALGDDLAAQALEMDVREVAEAAAVPFKRPSGS